MKTFVIQANLNKPYAQWEEAFLEHQAVRSDFGIEDVLHGQVEGEQQMVVVLRAADMQVLNQLMHKHAADMAATGHDLDSTVITVLV